MTGPQPHSPQRDIVGDNRHSKVPRIPIGLLGSSFMGRAHSRALYLLPALESDPAAVPVLQAICGRNRERLDQMQSRFGWRHALTDWRELVTDPSITAIVNTATNDMHAAPAIQAAAAGKHVLCEKPLGRGADEALAMFNAATNAGIVHMCAFNYRFFPAIRLCREMIEAGQIGEVLNFRSRFLLSSAADPASPETAWRLRSESAGSGVIGDLLAHHIDVARYLVGEPTAVSAATRIGMRERHGVTVDVEDAVVCTVEFAHGAIGTMEATRMTPGHVLDSAVEIDGTRASLTFDLQRLNELTVSSPAGVNTISVTAPEHPYLSLWWPHGHGIGWGDSFIHEARHFLGAITGAWPVAPHGATFLDGYRCALVCDAIVTAARTGVRQDISPTASPAGGAHA